MNGESFTRQVHRRVRCATRRHVACGDWFDVDRFRRQLLPGESISPNRFSDFLFSLFISCFYSSLVFYANVRLIKDWLHTFYRDHFRKSNNDTIGWSSARFLHFSFFFFHFLFLICVHMPIDAQTSRLPRNIFTNNNHVTNYGTIREGQYSS